MGEPIKVERMPVYITPVGYAEVNRRANAGDPAAKAALEAFKFRIEPGLDSEFVEDVVK